MFGQFKRFLGIQQTSASSQIPLTISWVIPGKLAVGPLPQPGNATQLLNANIKVVLSLCAESEGTLPDDVSQNFRCFRLVLPDRYYTSQLTADQLASAVKIVRQQMEQNLPIYVHCLAGVERSPTVCIAYLCRYQNLELWEAVNWLKQVHPDSIPTDSGLRAIREFQTGTANREGENAEKL